MDYGCGKTLRRYFINKEIKIVFFSLIVTLVLALGVFLIGINGVLNNISTNVVKENVGMAGKLVEEYPQLEDRIADIIKEPATDKHIKKGREILSQYGYKEDMSFKLQNLINGVYTKSIIEIIAAFIVLAIILLSIVFLGFSKIYSKIEKTTYIIQKVIDGNFSYNLKEDGEEFFDIFGNEFNKMSNCLKLNIDNLKKEKVFLKNIIEDISHQM